MRTRRISLAVLAVFAVVAVFGCSKEKAASKVLAKVGNTAITEADMQARIDQMPPYVKQRLSTPEGQKQLLDALVEEELIYKDARARGLDKSPEFKKDIQDAAHNMLIRMYFDKIIMAKATPTEDETKQYYEAHPSEFVIPESVTARHILVKTREEALRLRRQIEQGADFGEAAGKYSLDAASKSAGGMISGSIQKGGAIRGLGVVPELTDAALQLKEGEISEPVQTPKGFDIIQVIKRTPESTKALDEAKEDIVAKLEASKQKTAKEDAINELKSKYKVVYMTGAQASEATTPEELFKMASEAATPQDKIKYYREFVNKYPKDERAYEAQFMIGFTMAEELKDYDGAEKVFKEFLEQYPNSDLSDDARWMLENMRSGKQPDMKGE
jgi:peptidyl-prolyl cis-trans isomerase C